MSLTEAHVVALARITCGECGMAYGIPERYRAQKEEAGGHWNCPGCKVRWGYAEGENKALRRRLLAAQERAGVEARRRASVERSLAATKGHVTRQKKRAAAGVCPCCNRTFKQLARHMKSKHPTYTKED